MWLVLLISLACAKAQHVNDTVFSVVRATPLSDDHLRLFNSLYKDSHKYDLDFWKSPTGVGYSVDIMAPEEKITSLRTIFEQSGIPSNVTIADVQKLIIDREQKTTKSSLSSWKLGLGSFFKRVKDDPPTTTNRAKYRFGEYSSYGEIVRWLNEISQEYPNIAKVSSIGTTFEGRNIIAIKIGRDPSRNDKRVVWIDGGIHAREWGAIHTALYFIEQLIVGYGSDPIITSYVDNLSFFIVPVVNPDGFEYTRSDITPMKRLWRKNRAGITCNKDQWFRDRCCGGVDLNRNFDFHWGGAGSSDDACSEIYQGTTAFSELESRAIRDTMLAPELYGKVDAFITLHTYSQMWIHPYSHARRSVPADIAELQSVGRRAVNALEGVYGTKYRFGTGADILYPSSGGSDDWAKAKGNAKYVYLLELRPGEEVWDGFVLDPRQLVPMGKETWEGIKVVVQAVYDKQQGSLTSSQIVAAQQAARQPQQQTLTVVGDDVVLSTVTPSTTVFLTRRITKRPETTTQVSSIERIISTGQKTRSDSSSGKIFRAGKRPSSFRKRLRDLLLSTRSRRLGTTVVGGQVTREQQQMQQLQQQQRLQQAQQQRLISLQGTRSSFGQGSSSRSDITCRDISPWCRAWLRGNPNVCRVSSIYMSRDCRATCRFC